MEVGHWGAFARTLFWSRSRVCRGDALGNVSSSLGGAVMGWLQETLIAEGVGDKGEGLVAKGSLVI